MESLKEKGERHRETPENSSIFIQEEGLVVKNLITETEKIQAYHLRHRVFAQELGWVPKSENALEIDNYDDNAVFFGVFDRQNNLVAYLRLILFGGSFMLEKEFSPLVGVEHKLRKENDTTEISRLCVAPEVRNNIIIGNLGVYSISVFLFKGVYQWCIRNSVRYLYAVAEQNVYRLFRSKGFPYKLIGERKRMPDGVIAVAIIMDWREFEALNSEKRPDMLKWFTQYQSTPVEQQRQQPEAYSQHQVSF